MNLRSFLVASSLLLISGVASAGPTCNEPKDTWINQDAFQTQLKEKGYKIKRFKVTSGECFEIYGWNPQGERVEIYFNPATGEPLKTKRG